MKKKFIKGLGFSLFVVLVMTAFSSVVLADDSGWLSPTQNFDDGVTFEERAYSQNDQYAIFDSSSDDATYYGFGTIVPSGAIIDGIEVRMDAFKQSSSSRTFDIRLYTGNTARGNTVNQTLPNSDTDTYIVIGASTTFNWGYTGWDDTNVNTLRVRVDSTSGGDNAYLDHIQVRVHYHMPTYDITYNLDGGTNAVANPATFQASTPTIVLEDAVKAGYNFEGWFSDEALTTEVTEIPMGSTCDVELFAKWSLKVFEINYETNGGTNGCNPIEYDILDDDIILRPPTKPGFVFGGWYDNPEFSGTAITTIPVEDANNVTLYAKWVAVPAAALPQTGQYAILIGALSTIGVAGAGLVVLKKKK